MMMTMMTVMTTTVVTMATWVSVSSCHWWSQMMESPLGRQPYNHAHLDNLSVYTNNADKMITSKRHELYDYCSCLRLPRWLMTLVWHRPTDVGWNKRDRNGWHDMRPSIFPPPVTVTFDLLTSELLCQLLLMWVRSKFERFRVNVGHGRHTDMQTDGQTANVERPFDFVASVYILYYHIQRVQTRLSSTHWTRTVIHKMTVTHIEPHSDCWLTSEWLSTVVENELALPSRTLGTLWIFHVRRFLDLVAFSLCSVSKQSFRANVTTAAQWHCIVDVSVATTTNRTHWKSWTQHMIQRQDGTDWLTDIPRDSLLHEHTLKTCPTLDAVSVVNLINTDQFAISNLLDSKGNYSATSNNTSWYTGRWWVGCYVWYCKEGPGRLGPRPVASSLYQM